ncbi:molybdopterin oxidoreductase family protein [Nocardioides immobilis]|uniref:Molybdopterin oxidoreductase family protein n=1 Tax=Nocardioides immobilis TaxID=2049295 RepID=A0A417Y0X1_9ACTN|nr:molybdopterin-dependent oxidoreductase [Nocardioides immobilis]RHW26310.1 molybdopterin oxidoreductase family protein [Nocardioides immobilis]
MSEHLATCPLCEVACGIRVKVEGDEIVGIRGDADHPATRGFICPKGTALQSLHHDPDRLRAPLVRRGGELVETTWEDAFRFLEERLAPIVAEGGPDAVAWHLGTPLTHDYGTWIYGNLSLRLAEAKQVYTTATVDHMPMMTAAGLMFGARDTNSFSSAAPDVDACHLLVLVGCNPLVSNATGITAPRGRLKAIQERGGRIIVIDPARTATAELADLHLAVRPGGDAALLAAVAQVIFDEGLDRLDVLGPHIAGAEELRTAVAPFTPEAVSDRCGIAPEVIRELAREMANAPSTAIYGRVGAMTQEFGTVTTWFMYALAAVTGNLDRPGGTLFPMGAAATHNTRGVAGRGAPFPTDRWRSRVGGHPEVLGELPVGALADEILADGSPIRALITMASNGARSVPDSARYEAAARHVELLVSVDHYVNETTRHADLILPPPSAVERDHYDIFFEQLASRNHTRWTDAVMPPPPDAYSEHDILLELTAVLGGFGDMDRGVIDDMLLSALVHDIVEEPGSVLADLDPQDVLAALGDVRGPQRGLDLLLRAGPYGDHFGQRPGGLTLDELKRHPHGIDLGPLQPRLPDVLRTPSGRVELAPEPLVADLRRVYDGLGDDPGLVIIGRRQTRSLNSWMHNVPALMRGRDRCTVLLHPDDASAHGLVDGARCEISSDAGAVEATVEVSDEIRRGVVSLPHGWGHEGPGLQLSVAEQHPGANLNALTGPGGLDVPSGTAAFSGVPVALRALPTPA